MNVLVANMSAHVNVAAGSCRVMLHGTVMVKPLTTRVPPHWLLSVMPRQRALLTVAS